MKRYRFERDGIATCHCDMEENKSGYYVLYHEAKAEIDRLTEELQAEKKHSSVERKALMTADEEIKKLKCRLEEGEKAIKKLSDMAMELKWD